MRGSQFGSKVHPLLFHVSRLLEHGVPSVPDVTRSCHDLKALLETLLPPVWGGMCRILVGGLRYWYVRKVLTHTKLITFQVVLRPSARPVPVEVGGWVRRP